MNELRPKIMRRVYYIFALRFIKHPVITHTAAVALCFFVLSRLVSIRDVFSNMLEVKVGELLQFWISAFLNTGALTLVVVGLILFVVLSLPWRLRMHEAEKLAFR